MLCFVSSCKEQEPNYCDITFWVESDNVEQFIDVHLFSDQTGYDATRQITKYYSGITPDCWDEGCASFHVKEGRYYFQAENDYYYWEGEMDIYSECHKMKLYVGRAYVKPGATPQVLVNWSQFSTSISAKLLTTNSV